MILRFHINPETGERHMLDHGVTEEEVWEVMESPVARKPGHDETIFAIGQTHAGRWLQIILVEDPVPNSYFVITAYPPSSRAVRAIRRRRRN